MTTPANYATLIAEIDVVIESYGLSLQEVFGGRSTQPTLQELIDLRYELFEVDGGGGSSDPSQIVSSTLPTTRVGGAALQIGDRWYRPSTGKEGFWNGTYFLNTIPFRFQGFLTMPSSATVSIAIDCNDGGLFFESFDYNIAANVFNWDVSNYQSLSIVGFSPNGTGIAVLSNATNGKMQYDNPADLRLQKKSIAINFANLFSSSATNTISRQVDIIFTPIGSVNGIFTYTLLVRGILL